ncbi:sugar O-acetyltransferase [Weissella halotolerans]|uniref:Maltose/galactoside acetyltransferase domain-containing protein n=1 Tax=Weissella halotolerans DSM 20190 TaxID=1123500 RepID=A0A0R2FZQ4_9LACO|nr:sugar O-acetyltransferase [Weissella halotolerans]KRN33688.1 hypothetical protein IV68_GL000496 [Weissella halotolerans DSM 20190]
MDTPSDNAKDVPLETLAVTTDRLTARNKCFQYNQMLPVQDEARMSLLEDFFGAVGSKTQILAPFQCDFGFNIYIGHNFYAGYNLVIADMAKVTIGDNVKVGANCTLQTSVYSLNPKARARGLRHAKPIVIDDDVWIQANAVILPGVTIGARSIVQAGTVVATDIPADTVVAGNPMQVLQQAEKN